jgi:hypothetical protein
MNSKIGSMYRNGFSSLPEKFLFHLRISTPAIAGNTIINEIFITVLRNDSEIIASWDRKTLSASLISRGIVNTVIIELTTVMDKERVTFPRII